MVTVKDADGLVLGAGPAVTDIHKVSPYMLMLSEDYLEHQTEHLYNNTLYK